MNSDNKAIGNAVPDYIYFIAKESSDDEESVTAVEELPLPDVNGRTDDVDGGERDNPPQHLTFIHENSRVNFVFESPTNNSPVPPTGSPDSNSSPNAGQEPSPNNARRAAIIAGVAVGTGVAAVVAAPLALAAVGFGGAGVAAGSLAALWQSSIGSVAAGSLFATLQSAGAAGLAATTSAALGAASGVVGGAVAAGSLSRKRHQNETSRIDPQ